MVVKTRTLANLKRIHPLNILFFHILYLHIVVFISMSLIYIYIYIYIYTHLWKQIMESNPTIYKEKN